MSWRYGGADESDSDAVPNNRNPISMDPIYVDFLSFKIYIIFPSLFLIRSCLISLRTTPPLAWILPPGQRQRTAPINRKLSSLWSSLTFPLKSFHILFNEFETGRATSSAASSLLLPSILAWNFHLIWTTCSYPGLLGL